jgi:hypothetical protein
MKRPFLVLLCAGATAACGQGPVHEEWDPGAVRAVARAEAATEPGTPLVARPTIGGPGGEELPWGIRQTLTTAGIELASGEPAPGVRLLTFHDARREGDDWILRTNVERNGTGSRKTTWRVRCAENSCIAAPEPEEPGV